MKKSFLLKKAVYVSPALEVIVMQFEEGFAATSGNVVSARTPAANLTGNDDYVIEHITFEGGWEE